MSDPYPIFGSQDLKDDDGRVIDSFLTETDAPPDLKPAIEPITVIAPPAPRYRTVVKAGYQIITNTMLDSFQLYSADPNRVEAKLYVTSLNATPDLNQYITIADNKMSLNGTPQSGQAFRLRQGKTLELDAHTGALWVIGASTIAAEGIEITWILTSEVK